MSQTIRMTRAALAKGLTLATGKWHRVQLVPDIECLRLLGLFFDTNKAFILPATLEVLEQVPKQLARHPDGEIMIYGHTDTSGEASTNDPLSARRAEMVRAYLRRDVDAWLAMYDASVPEKQRWGAHEDFLMVAQMRGFAWRPSGLTPIRWYQQQKDGELAVDGIAGAKTRRLLIADYMALRDANVPESVSIAAVGCGERFPLDDSGLAIQSNPHSNKRDALDRRVELFFFNPIAESPPPKTPSAYPAWLARSTALQVANGGTASRVLRLRLLEAGAALVSKEYLISSGSKVIAGGMLSADGLVEAVITGGDQEVVVEVPDAGWRQTLVMLPSTTFPGPDTVLGAQLRLANLGFYSGAADSERSQAFDDAIAAFRKSQGLTRSSHLDAVVAESLRDTYGS